MRREWTGSGIRDARPLFPGQTDPTAEYILWRRVAGGLSRERQERVLASELDRLRQQKSPPPELIRLAGSLERIGHELKSELVRRFIDRPPRSPARGSTAPLPRRAGLLLNRAPLYADRSRRRRPLVERAYEAFTGFDGLIRNSRMQTLFLPRRGVVDDRSLDLPKALRNRAMSKLEGGRFAYEDSPAPGFHADQPLRARRPLRRSLPPGLILGGSE